MGFGGSWLNSLQAPKLRDALKRKHPLFEFEIKNENRMKSKARLTIRNSSLKQPSLVMLKAMCQDEILDALLI